MEYIKKEELKEGEIYKNTGNNIIFKCINDKTSQGIGFRIINKCFVRNNWFSSNPEYLLATSEEKHWLNSCIKLDKFITYEEAMKTFIPEYVECNRSSVNGFTENKIYKIEKNWNDSINFQLIDDNSSNRTVIMIGSLWQLKPSTKEAYDAQFVVKEPEFVLPLNWLVKITDDNLKILNDYRFKMNPKRLYGPLPTKYDYSYMTQDGNGDDGSAYFDKITFEQFKKYVLKEEVIEEKVIEQPIIENKTELEIWLENTKSLNLSLDVLTDYIGNPLTCDFDNIFKKLEGYMSKDKANILFNKWNDQVIEPLPQFKIIESIETITKVENNEGNQFFIGDVVKSSNGTIQTIESFDYNKAKTNIIAFTNKQSILGNGIGIDKIEHYIEPKVEETLLEKAKRLYPIGTKFKVACNPKYIATVKDHNDYPFQDIDIVNLNTIENIDGCTGMTVFYKGKWAEIIE